MGITDLKVQRGSITVFPNPTSDKITISAPTKGHLFIPLPQWSDNSPSGNQHDNHYG
jgi:hypothetical protein